MKVTKHFAAIPLAAIALLTSCDESMFSGSQTEAGTGTIVPIVSYDATVNGASGTRAVTEYTDITVKDLTLTLTYSETGETSTFAYNDFPTDKGFAVGKYKLTASYGDSEEEGFEKPAVYGETDFTVNEGKSTTVSLTAVPSKAMVGITFDDSALNYFTALEASLHSVGGQTVAYSTDETRYAYLIPGEVTLDVTFTKPNGQGATMEVAKFNTVAQHRYTVGIKLGDETGTGVGELGLTITFDETLEKEDVTVDISDEVLNAPAPEVTLSGVAEGETISMIVGSTLEEPVRIDIKSQSGIKSAVLTTTGKSTSLPTGWPAEIDLVTASDADQQTLTSLGFKNIGIFGKTELAHLAAFELTDVINNLPATAQDVDPVTFSLKVTDNNGKVASEKPLTFYVKIDDIELTIENIDGEVYNGQETVNVLAHFNGTNLASILKVSYLPNSGVYKETMISNIQQQSDDTESYIVSVVIPDDAQIPVKLKFNALNMSAVDLEIPTGTLPTVTVNENDVFAKSAWATVNSEADREATIEVSTNGTTYASANVTIEDGDYHVTGLTPGTTYYVRSKVGALPSEPVLMKTETATQIPGSDMESWSEQNSISKGACTWHYNNPSDPWYGSNSTSYQNVASTSYRSGTSAVGMSTDVHGNSYSAYIRTTGSRSTGYYNTPDNVYKGEMTLGDNNSGYTLTSRPSAVSFWYKYTAYKSGDQGLVEITVTNGENGVISFTKNLDPTDTFTQITTPVYTYSKGAAENVKIKIRFVSTATDSYLSSDCTNTVSKNLLSVGSELDAFIGSTLLIDDIELVY